jgi:alpha-tubulin suppressor-like RCC1 family protein
MYNINNIQIDPLGGNNTSDLNDWETEIPDSTLLTKAMILDYYPNLPIQLSHGGIWGVGNNSSGQLDASRSTRSSPVQNNAGGFKWKQVSAGLYHTTAINGDGTLWVSGLNGNGQLGDNTITPKSSPIQTIAGGTNWKLVSAGRYFTGAIKTDGTLWMWGLNTLGQLGDNSVTNRSSPVQTVSTGTNWQQVMCGYSTTAAIKTDGTLWLWGNNVSGGLGTNDIVHRSSPVQTVSGGTNWKQVTLGINYSAAIKTDGTLWLWGYNTYGSLGTNDIVHRSSPVQSVAGGTNWKQVSSYTKSTAAIKTDGTLWMWGHNTNGTLGDNTVAHKSSPVQTISGGTNWKTVSSGDMHTAAIKTDGTVWLWGLGTTGQLGDNTILSKSSPVQTVTAGTDWKQVSAGYAFTLFLREYNFNF